MHATSARKLAGTPRMQVPSGLGHMGTAAGPDNAAAFPHLFLTSADCPEIPKNLACILHMPSLKLLVFFNIPRDAVLLAETTGWQTWDAGQLIHQACSHGARDSGIAGLIDSANQEPQHAMCA